MVHQNGLGQDLTENDIQHTQTLGRVMTVQSSQSCWVLYKVGDIYQRVEAQVNPYATATADEDTVSEYNFVIPQGAANVTIVLAGDVNMDGTVDAQDVSAVVANRVDINGNGVVNGADKILLALALLGYKSLTW